jgi:hydroxymethylglutaryl-CoA lyase
VDIIGIVVNEKGADRAIRTGAVHTLGYPYSISAGFLLRNQHQTLEESLASLRTVVARARAADLDVVAYLSMAFGNPYGEPWSIGTVLSACHVLIEAGVRQISLADTVGLATPAQIAETIAAVVEAHREIDIGAHLHARRNHAAALVRAAWDAGCRRFDAAIGGLGGCPFAQDQLVSNLSTEILLRELTACGAEFPKITTLDELVRASAQIATHCDAPVS